MYQHPLIERPAMRQEKRRDRLTILIAAGLTGVIFLLSNLPNRSIPGMLRLYMVGDNLAQCIAFIRMFWRNLIGGRGLTYSFSLGMGMPTWAQYAYYCLSPCNLLFLFVKDNDLAMFLVMELKLMLAAGAFAWFAIRELHTRRDGAVLIAVSYALCGYAITYRNCILFAEMLMIAPVLVRAMLQFIRTRRWHILCVVYAYSFIVWFYGGYITGIVSAVFFVGLLWYYGIRGRERRFFLFRYLCCVGTAVLISAVITLPTGVWLISHRSEEASAFLGIRAGLADQLAGFGMLRRQGVMDDSPPYYSGLAVLYLATLYCCGAHGRREKALFLLPLVFLILCGCVPFLYLFLHAFDPPNGYAFRFAYLVSFLLCVCAAREWEAIREERRTVRVAALVLDGLLLGTPYLLQRFGIAAMLIGVTGGVTIAELVLLLAWYVVLHRRWSTIAVGCAVIELTANAAYQQLTEEYDPLFLRRHYDAWEAMGEAVLGEIAQAEQSREREDFYRIYYMSPLYYNDGMLLGYHGLGYFTSMEYSETRRVMRSLGYAGADRVLKDYGSTEVTRMLFAQRYHVDTGGPSFEISEGYRLTREEALPLAYMVSADILKYQALSDCPFYEQSELVSSMLGEHCELYTLYDSEVLAETEGLDVRDAGEEYELVLSEGAEDGELTLEIPAADFAADYAYIAVPEMGVMVDSPILYSAAEGGRMTFVHGLLMEPHVLPVAEEEGAYCVKVITHGMPIRFNQIYYAAFHPERLQAAYEQLSKRGMELQSFREDRIEGRVYTDAAFPILFTSIPYDKGWVLEVDGVQTETIALADGAFLGAYLEPGEHQIVLRYHDRMIAAGAAGTLVGLLLLIIDMTCAKRRKEEVWRARG